MKQKHAESGTENALKLHESIINMQLSHFAPCFSRAPDGQQCGSYPQVKKKLIHKAKAG